MQGRTVAFRFLLPLAFALFSGACGLLPEQAVRLITSRPEMAAYVERYNARQSDVYVEIEYQETPYRAVLDDVQGDIVVGEWLCIPSAIGQFEPVSEIVKPGRLDPAWFYASLLSMGAKDNRQYLIPLAFDLPTIVFLKQSVTAELSSMFMPLETLRTLAGAFNTQGKSGFSTMGFSPLWNKEFLVGAAQVFGARFRAGRNGAAAWEVDGLAKAVDLTSSWLSEVNGGAAADNAFASRNFVQPWYKLLSTKKILFALISFRQFISLPEDKRSDFDFRWMSIGNSVPAMDDVLFAGILRRAHNKKGARAFLEWFFSPQVQKSLLDVNQSRRVGVFGITDGFSSLKSVNEKELPPKYSVLLGHIPAETQLLFPEPLPEDWPRIRDEVIIPWMAATASGTDGETLEKRIEEWIKAVQK